MKIYHQDDIENYMRDDWILRLLKQYETEETVNVRTHRWLVEMENKRMIFADMYGDLLTSKDKKRKILDVGGGYHSLTKLLAQNNNYTLLDFFAHGVVEDIQQKCLGWKMKCQAVDWYDFDDGDDYDIVVANDIFPDVDQRMELFIDRYICKCREMRLLFTFYNTPRFYSTVRLDDTERLTFLSWDGEIISMKLKKWLEKMDASEFDLQSLNAERKSIFRNGRHVGYVRIQGDLA